MPNADLLRRVPRDVRGDPLKAVMVISRDIANGRFLRRCANTLILGYSIAASLAVAQTAAPARGGGGANVREVNDAFHGRWNLPAATIASLGLEYYHPRDEVLAAPSLPRCTITGLDGDRTVDAFIGAERAGDSAAHTCAKLDKASYLGHCPANSSGALEGICVVLAEGSGKDRSEAFIGYFSGGRPLYPMLTSPVAGPYIGFGVQESRVSYACVLFGSWSEVARPGCVAVRRLFGADILTERNARALRERVFDIEPVRAAFVELMDRASSAPPSRR